MRDFLRKLLSSDSAPHAHCHAELRTLNHELQREVAERRGTEAALQAAHDDLERRMAERTAELLKLQAELAHVARVTTMGELTASIAHEVNQPLTAVVANANAALLFMAAQPPDLKEVRESLDQILREGTRAGEVVRSIRGLFTKHAPQAAAHDLNDSIREVLALLQDTLRTHQVGTQLELADDLREVLGDRVQLQQVILNLMLNAIEAMSEVEDRPRSLGVHSAMEDGQTVLLRVSDSGVGLGAEGLERPFEPFFTTKAEGMGMGLSVSRSIVESHGGRLWASTNEGPGATFHLSLPVA